MRKKVFQVPIILIAVLTFTLIPRSVFALSQDQLNLYQLGITMFDNEVLSCSSAVASPGVPGATSGSWSSGLQPPYILEQFAIETLKDVAQKRGVPASSAVTQEHVIALVAFMFGEGGDINNQDLFNPLNTGINAPELLASSNAVDGLQSFKSFDAGVEATARTIVGSNQSRLADVLTDPSSTADKFMYALTYYKQYAGNAFWAKASVDNPVDYYNQRLQLVQQVRNKYADIAGLVLGTPEREQIKNITAKEKLTYHPTSDTSSTTNQNSSTGDGGSGSCSVSGSYATSNIVQMAINLSWESSHGLTPKPEYAAAVRQYNPGGLFSFNGADCGVFIATVMHATGADPNYPASGTSNQIQYAKSHPEKYQVLDRISSTADLQPGDILATSVHTWMFIGAQPDGKNAASASLGQRMPNLGMAEMTDSTGTPYTRIRIIK